MRDDVAKVRWACPLTGEQIRDLFQTFNEYRVTPDEITTVGWNPQALMFELVFEKKQPAPEAESEESSSEK